MRMLFPILAGALALAALAPAAQAQAPNRPAMSPQVQARMKAWQKFRDTHKNLFALQQTMFSLEQLERDPKTRLTKAQAQKILAAVKPWRTRATMSDAQALKLNKQITAPLTLAQLKKVTAARERRPGGGPGGRAGGPGMGGAPRPGGPGGNRGGAPDLSRFPAPKEYNPLNPSTIPMERQRARAKERLDAYMKVLTARAAGK